MKRGLEKLKTIEEIGTYELKLDLDGKYREKELTQRLLFVNRFLNMQDIKIKKSRTKHGYHIRIIFNTSRKLDDFDILFLQTILMSDYKREMYNWLRIKSKCKRWNALFNKKIRDSKIVSKEIPI